MSHAAIILAAGYGSLRGPNGRGFPKLLELVGDQPMIVRVVGTTLAAGLSPCIVVTNQLRGPMIRRELEKRFPGAELVFATQEDRYGSGDATLQGARLLDPASHPNCTVLCGDMPLWRAETLGAISEAHQGADAAMTMATYEFSPEHRSWFSGFGRVIRGRDGKVIRISEARRLLDYQANFMFLVNPALMCFRTAWLRANLPRLATHEKGDNYPAETYLPELVEIASQEGGVAEFPLSDPVELLGVNTQEELERVREELSQHLQEGRS